jgi:hypothetical protein
MTMVDENALRQYAGVLETAMGRRAGETQIWAAIAAGAGGRAMVTNPEDVLLVAALAAVVAANESKSRIHLATADTAAADRLTAAFGMLGLEKIVCAPIETFVFTYLRGTGESRDFALVADTECSLLRDGNIPIIISKPAPEGTNLISPEIKIAADHQLVRGRDYTVQDGKIIVRDPKTGSLFPGRRFSGSLHTAIQTREGIPAQSDGEVVAQITLRDYFRLYLRLSAVVSIADARYQTEYGLAVTEAFSLPS